MSKSTALQAVSLINYLTSNQQLHAWLPVRGLLPDWLRNTPPTRQKLKQISALHSYEDTQVFDGHGNGSTWWVVIQYSLALVGRKQDFSPTPIPTMNMVLSQYKKRLFICWISIQGLSNFPPAHKPNYYQGKASLRSIATGPCTAIVHWLHMRQAGRRPSRGKKLLCDPHQK